MSNRLIERIAMLVATFSVRIDKGLFMANNGYEFALVMFAASPSLLLSGAGRASADGALAAAAPLMQDA